MGLQPILPPRVTRIEAVKRDYIAGRFDEDEMERRIGELLANGTGDEPAQTGSRS